MFSRKNLSRNATPQCACKNFANLIYQENTQRKIGWCQKLKKIINNDKLVYERAQPKVYNELVEANKRKQKEKIKLCNYSRKHDEL